MVWRVWFKGSLSKRIYWGYVVVIGGLAAEGLLCCGESVVEVGGGAGFGDGSRM